MPPKPKFSKEEIINTAFELVKLHGMEALTARSLGEKLGSSSRPIFTVFDSMEEVQQNVVCFAKDLYTQYVKQGLSEELAFRGVGKAYIRFAAEQPKLFQLLFMREQENFTDINNVLGVIDSNSEEILKSIETGYGLKGDAAKRLYQHLWIYSHGIAVLIATKVCEFKPAEISKMLTEVFTGILIKIKSEGKQ